MLTLSTKRGVILSNEIVKYENRLNLIPLRRFNSREMNLFFAIVQQVHDKGTTDLTFTFNQLRFLSQAKQHGSDFVADLEKTYDKLLKLNARTDDGNRIVRFVAFTRYEIIREKEVINIRVNPDFKGLFNELDTWTRFSLEQFTSLRSTYSKTIFRLLKQYRTVGERKFSVEEFRTLLDVPKSYSIYAINKRVLKPIKEELSPIFKGLAIRKQRGGRGGKIVGYTFSWKPEKKDANDFSKGKFWDEKIALDNIEHNDELTDQEKWRAIDKIKGLPLGSTEKRRTKKVIEAVESDTLNDLRNMLKH